ncbi:hypothetical protein [Aquidulcibacter sp.]|uniref:hypothetical protein n=1 Tax=Aquidulcibacter sp. TaxID=2052990 RepID=UPI0025BAF734|nr:hypothetical protein [Aquidulcibacter sp.]MCA3696758.1 hypothetical protein [Aquidulcibacter sp.]
MHSKDVIDRISNSLTSELRASGGRTLITWIVNVDTGVQSHMAVLFDQNSRPTQHTFNRETILELVKIEESAVLPKDWFGVEWLVYSPIDCQVNQLSQNDLPLGFNLFSDSLYDVIVAKHQEGF